MRVQVTRGISPKTKQGAEDGESKRRERFGRERFLRMEESFLPEKEYETIRPGLVNEAIVMQSEVASGVYDRPSDDEQSVLSMQTLTHHLSFILQLLVRAPFAAVKMLLRTTGHCLLALLILSHVFDYEVQIRIPACVPDAELTIFLSATTLPAVRPVHPVLALGPMVIALSEQMSSPHPGSGLSTFCVLATMISSTKEPSFDSRDDTRTMIQEPARVVEDRDFAGIADGGKIIVALTSPSYNPQAPRFRPDITLWQWLTSRDQTLDVVHTAAAPLSSGAELGQCWPCAGTSGQLGIHLSRPIHISSMIIEHPLYSLHDTLRQSAPRTVMLWGLLPQDEGFPVNDHDAGSSMAQQRIQPSPYFGSYEGVEILSGVFNISQDDQRQIFSLANYSHTSLSFDHVVVQILDNWGKESYTCLYRVEVVGSPKLT